MLLSLSTGGLVAWLPARGLIPGQFLVLDHKNITVIISLTHTLTHLTIRHTHAQRTCLDWCGQFRVKLYCRRFRWFRLQRNLASDISNYINFTYITAKSTHTKDNHRIVVRRPHWGGAAKVPQNQTKIKFGVFKYVHISN